MRAGHWLPAYRNRETIRSAELSAGGYAHRSRGLSRAALEQPGLLPGGGKTAGARDSAARPMDARDADGVDAPEQPSGLAGHARHRYRRDERIPLLFSRARRYSAH